MRTLITTSLALSLLLSTYSAQAYYFVKDPSAIYENTLEPQTTLLDDEQEYEVYTPPRRLQSLPGWPSWIGRLDQFSNFVFGQRFDELTDDQQSIVTRISDRWPDWIGVPRW